MNAVMVILVDVPSPENWVRSNPGFKLVPAEPVKIILSRSRLDVLVEIIKVPTTGIAEEVLDQALASKYWPRDLEDLWSWSYDEEEVPPLVTVIQNDGSYPESPGELANYLANTAWPNYRRPGLPQARFLEHFWWVPRLTPYDQRQMSDPWWSLYVAVFSLQDSTNFQYGTVKRDVLAGRKFRQILKRDEPELGCLHTDDERQEWAKDWLVYEQRSLSLQGLELRLAIHVGWCCQGYSEALDSILEYQQVRAKLVNAVFDLQKDDQTKDDYFVIDARFGLSGGKKHTLEETALRLKLLTKRGKPDVARVRQKELRILKQLRQAIR